MNITPLFDWTIRENILVLFDESDEGGPSLTNGIHLALHKVREKLAEDYQFIRAIIYRDSEGTFDGVTEQGDFYSLGGTKDQDEALSRVLAKLEATTH